MGTTRRLNRDALNREFSARISLIHALCVHDITIDANDAAWLALLIG